MVRGERARRRTGVKPCMISLLRALDLARNVWEVPRRAGRDVLLVGDEKADRWTVGMDLRRSL